MKENARSIDTIHPETRFGTPEALLESELSSHEKRQLLERWRTEEEALLRAASEGMDGDDTPMLGRVKKALVQLN